MGDFTVFFEFVSAPPITPKPQLPAAVQRGFVKNIDWTFTTWVIFSYMMFFGFIIYMENADWEVDTGIQEVPESLARLIFEAPIEPPTVEEELEEGEGEEEETKTKAPDKKPAEAEAEGTGGSAPSPLKPPKAGRASCRRPLHRPKRCCWARWAERVVRSAMCSRGAP